RRVLLIGGLVLLLSQSVLAAGSGSIRGKVLDRETKEPLPGATVLVKGTSIGASSDLNGEYRIPVVQTGNQSLTVSYVGYVPVTVEVSVIENKDTEKDIYLEPTAITGKAVIVTAQAQGQLGAINQQLSSNTIENVVSKARIQEMPDVNAAESIGRLPGVSIERSGGEATKVEIRGLGPKYSLITVNGVALPATGGIQIQPNGTTVMSSDRSVDLSLIPSNMLDGITLKKVVTPDMDPDVLGGTVDLKLKEAPSGPQFNASVQGGYNKLQNYYGDYNFVATVSNRFFDERLGAIAGGHLDNYDRSADKFQGNYDETQQYGITQAKVRE
ncbi:MAG: carboxypeptidase-like regulatory domain-containing protein, partial [Bacteroidetes bacterium]|nr:carboxypeptidase-like regulatory domain-containing protein [Bacteroidota bacterium]